MTTIGLAMSVYNGAETLDEALASVEAQTQPPDQIVIVDDGSTDDTAATVRRWSERLPIDFVRQANAGVAAGRTAAVSRLTTDSVLGLDADDVWLPNHLERLVDLHSRYGGITAPLAVRWRPGHTGGLVARPQRELTSVLVMNSIFSGSLFDRDDYEDVGGEYRFDGCEDWDLWLRLMRAGAEVHTVGEPTVRYRISPDSLSADDRGLPTECAVLETFLAETDDLRLRRVAKLSLRHRHARQALRRSYDLAEHGRLWAARAAAVETAPGPANVRVRGLAMLLAPGVAVRRRASLRGDR